MQEVVDFFAPQIVVGITGLKMTDFIEARDLSIDQLPRLRGQIMNGTA